MPTCPKCGQPIAERDIHFCDGDGGGPQVAIQIDILKLLDKGWRIWTWKKLTTLTSSPTVQPVDHQE
jgi:hypothetical protein